MRLPHSSGRQCMDKNRTLWRRFYECACHHEGIMMGYIYEEDDKFPVIDLAFVKIDKKFTNHGKLSWSERLRWCWHVILSGDPWLDMVTLNRECAIELARDLNAFAKGKLK